MNNKIPILIATQHLTLNDHSRPK